MSTFQTLLHLVVIGVGVMNLLDVLSIVELGGATAARGSDAYNNGARAGQLVWVGVGAFAAYRLWQARGPADAPQAPANGASSVYVGPGGRAAMQYPPNPAPQPQAPQPYGYTPQPQAAQPYGYAPQPQAAQVPPSVAPPAGPHPEAGA